MIQSNLDTKMQWSEIWLQDFTVNKYKAIHLIDRDIKHEYKIFCKALLEVQSRKIHWKDNLQLLKIPRVMISCKYQSTQIVGFRSSKNIP